MIDAWLETTPFRIGEILGQRNANGAFELCHREDEGRAELMTYASPEDATAIARHDDAGKYRPLKTAPNLRHGWRLLLPGLRETRLALELFYPGRLAALAAARREELTTTPLRATLERQTGMYRVAGKLSDDEADDLIAKLCRSDGGCLRTILWARDRDGNAATSKLPSTKFDPAFDQTGRGEAMLPLLCQEACNLLVAEARNIVKAR